MKRKVLLKGQAGLDLLHRISSIHVPALPPGQTRTGLLLNPAGRIQSCFEIAKTAPDAVEISFRDAFLELLEHYTFAERYELSELPVAEEPQRTLRERILLLVPEEGHEFHPDGETNPLEVNLASAIDENKGCYPGQEVIEKIISLGSPARRLCLLRRMITDGDDSTDTTGAALPLPAILLDSAGAEAGKLTSSDGDVALAIVKRTHLKEGSVLSTHGVSWHLERVST
jgi:folate-binding protein YgfZ